MLTSGLEHYRRQQVITVAGLQAARRAKGRGSRSVAQVVTAYQILAARDATESVPLMLDEQGIDAPAEGDVAYNSVSGQASDGRPLDTLFDQAETDAQFDMMVATQLQDAARIAAGIAIVSRPQVTGYVRMLNPPSCSRCAILAGKFFKWNKGFERHPRCDCRHIPSSESLAGDLTTNPQAYFDSLSEAEQRRIFTNKGAGAIRDGADPAAIVNARRNMASVGDDYLVARGGKVRGGSGAGPAPAEGPDLLGFLREANAGVATGPGRLSPEGIYRLAGSRTEAIDLLRTHGYIL